MTLPPPLDPRTPCSSISTAPCWRSRLARSWSGCLTGCGAADPPGGAARRRAGGDQRAQDRRFRSPLAALARRRCRRAWRRTPCAAGRMVASGDSPADRKAAAALERLRPVLRDLDGGCPAFWSRTRAGRSPSITGQAPEKAARSGRQSTGDCARPPSAAADRRQDGTGAEAAPSRQGTARSPRSWQRSRFMNGCRYSSATIRPTRTGSPR